MRALGLTLLVFSFSSVSQAMFDGLFPYPVDAQSEREVFYQLLPSAKAPCARVAEHSGFEDLWTYLEVQPNRLPQGMENFLIVISACDTAQNCHKVQAVEFSTKQLNKLISRESVVEYGCNIKPRQRIETIRIDLFEDRPWYRSDRHIDAGQISLSELLLRTQSVMKTRFGTAEFQIDFKY